MEISYIKEFVVLAETNNFLEAADILFTSQSTLSRHIKSIESDLGHPLFDRTTRKVELNKFGELFLPYAKEIARIQYEYTTAFYNQLNTISGTVTLGTIPVISQYHISDAMTKFQQENTNFHLNVVEADSNVLIDMLLEDKCDFVFIREEDATINDEQLTKIHFDTDQLAAIMAPDHPLATESTLNLSQLRDENLLLLPPGTMMHDLCLNACHHSGFQPKITYTSFRGSNLIDIASKSHNIALLMRKTAMYISQSKVSMIDIHPPITTTINLAYKKNQKMSAASQHFLDCVKSL